jgi:GntR family transcriptional regulator, transcriptional repressor for pyruvate dehydrogenase complex
MPETLTKTRLYEEIIKQIIVSIKSGELKPGDRLPAERDLAMQMKVSRTAIREALRSLDTMGIIDSKVGSGTYIKEMSIDGLMDSFAGVLSKNERLIIELIEVRLLLEVEIARLAARMINEEKIKAIEKTLKTMEDEINDGGLGIKGDNAFHNELANAAENLAMTSILGLCGDLLDSTRKAALTALGDPRIGLESHRAIFGAVRAGDEDEAAKLMKKHLETAYRNLTGKKNV